MAILLTGGAGYIGSHVAWACADAGRAIAVVDNLSTGTRACMPAQAAFYEIDLSDREAMHALFAQKRFEAVLHFAGSIVVPESVADPLAYYANNTANSLALLRLAVKHQVAGFLFSSTAAVYAPSRQPMVGEDAPLGPLSPYGWSKLMTEQMLADAATAHGLRYCALRYFNVSGADPAERTGQCTPNATHLLKVAAQTALGLRPELVMYGDDYDTPDGACVRDFIHVADLANAHLLALEHLEAGGASGVYNVGYGAGASVKEVVAAFERVQPRRLPVRVGPRRAGDAPALIADSAKIRRELGWRPRHADLDALVASTLNWERRLLRGEAPVRGA